MLQKCVYLYILLYLFWLITIVTCTKMLSHIVKIGVFVFVIVFVLAYFYRHLYKDELPHGVEIGALLQPVILQGRN